MLSGDRAVSLDADGELVLWDTTVRDTGKIGNRLVDTLTTIDDHIRRYETTMTTTFPIPFLLYNSFIIVAVLYFIMTVGYCVSNTASLALFRHNNIHINTLDFAPLNYPPYCVLP